MKTRIIAAISGLVLSGVSGGCGSNEPANGGSTMSVGMTPVIPASGGTAAPPQPPTAAGRPGAVGSVAANGGRPALPASAGMPGSVVAPAAAGSGAAGVGIAGALAAAGGSAGVSAAGSSAAGSSAAGASGSVSSGNAIPGACCKDGKCICRDDAPTALTSEQGKYKTQSYSIQGVGCVYYPTDAEPPFSAVTISDGFGGSGGCGRTQTNNWGPLYASHGIVAMIVETGSSDQPNARGKALNDGVAAFKKENDKMGSPLFGKLAGRYGTSGFSMGGGGTTFASQSDPTLLSSVAMMPWGPVKSGVKVPTLIICGASDNTAPCASHGTPAYAGIADSVPKMRVQISGGHVGQPSAGGASSGKYGLAFSKAFLDGDERWLPLLKAADSEQTNIK